MIGFAIWDQTNLISNRFLRTYIRDTFFEITYNFENVKIHHDLEYLINQFDSSFTHLVIFQSGHTTRGTPQFKKAISDFCQQDFLIAGHIIHHINSYPHLHPQMFILNMNYYRKIDMPMIGYYEESDVIDLHRPKRSIENIHDDYTPLWLKPTHEITTCAKRNFGWNIIHESLNNNIPVINLSDRIRWSKRFLYPNDHPHLFADCLEKLSKDELETIPIKMNSNQRKYLSELMNPGMDKVFLFNTEKLIEKIPDIEIKQLFGVAAGFKLFILWHQLNKPKEIIYYDYNRQNLNVWKDIVTNWNGINFIEFCKKRGYEDDFNKMQEIIDIFGNNLEKKWQEYKTCNFKFVICDLLRNPERIVEMIDDNAFIWYSNCFKFFESIRRYGLKGTDEKEEKFIQMLKEKAPNTFVLGTKIGIINKLLGTL